MDRKDVFALLRDYNQDLIKRTVPLLMKIFDQQVAINIADVKNANIDELKETVGDKVLRIDIPFDDDSRGLTYLVPAELAPQVAAYLEEGGESAASVPEEMQLILDLSEQLVLLKNEMAESNLKKSIQFGNPSILVWNGEAVPEFENTLATFFSVSAAGKSFSIVQLTPEQVAKTLFANVNLEEGPIVVEKHELEELSSEENANSRTLPLEELYDLELEVTAEMGRVPMMLKDILELGVGGIVELNKFAGDPVDLYINNKKFAEGEVVVIEQNYAVRIISLVSARERIASLG